MRDGSCQLRVSEHDYEAVHVSQTLAAEQWEERKYSVRELEYIEESIGELLSP